MISYKRRLVQFARLIGMILIMANTFAIVLQIVLQVALLVVELGWTVLKALIYVISNYPLTIFALYIIKAVKRPNNRNQAEIS
jgi:hypothetical protein